MDTENAFTELFEQQRAADTEMLAKLITDSMEEEDGETPGEGNLTPQGFCGITLIVDLESLPRFPQIEEGFQKTLSLGDELDQVREHRIMVIRIF
jgi:hypothetical protein